MKEISKLLNKKIKIQDIDNFHDEDLITHKKDHRSKYSGKFEISPQCSINVQIFSKTTKTSSSSIKKTSNYVGKLFSLDHGTVKSERIYYKIDGIHMKEVEKDNVVSGYEYGNQKIKILPEIENQFKFQDERCLKLLAFVHIDQIPRHYGMGGVDVMLPDLENFNHLKAFCGLAESLLEQKKVILARFVSRKQSAPKLMTLIPKQIDNTKGKYCFYIIQLPTNEDTRHFRFNSLKKSNQVQRNLLSEFIDKLDCDREKNRFDLGNLIMPTTQLMNNQVMRKAITENIMNQPQALVKDPNRKLQGKYKDSIVEDIWDTKLNNQVEFELRIRENLGDLEQRIKNEFDLKENQNQESNAPKKYWADIIKENEEQLKEEEIIQKMKDDKKNQIPENISKNFAINDFNLMVSHKEEDLVDKAIKQMQVIIIEIVQSSVYGSHFSKALECIKTLRRASISEMESENFNKFMYKIKKLAEKDKSIKAFFNSMKENQINLISCEESEDSTVTQTNVKNYFEEECHGDYFDEENQQQESGDEELLRMMDDLE